VHKAADFLFVGIQKTEIFAAVNHLVSFTEIFNGKGRFSIGLDISRRFDQFAKSFRTGGEPLGQRLARAVHIIVKTAAGAAGFTGVRLAQDHYF